MAYIPVDQRNSASSASGSNSEAYTPVSSRQAPQPIQPTQPEQPIQPIVSNAQPEAKPSFWSGIVNSVKSIFSPSVPAIPTKENKVIPAPTPTVKPTSGYIPISKRQATKATPTQSPNYYSTTTPNGSVIGFSDKEFDTSGKPLLAYRNPGDKSTTTDRTRVATTFDPTTPKPLTKEEYYNPRAQGLRDDFRMKTGIKSSEQLDHAIALTVGGSNQPENLRAIPKNANQKAGAFEMQLAEQLKAGKISYFEAQVADAKYKGIQIPWTPEQIKQDMPNLFERTWLKIKDIVTPNEAKAAETNSIGGYIPIDKRNTGPVGNLGNRSVSEMAKDTLSSGLESKKSIDVHDANGNYIATFKGDTAYKDAKAKADEIDNKNPEGNRAVLSESNHFGQLGRVVNAFSTSAKDSVNNFLDKFTETVKSIADQKATPLDRSLKTADTLFSMLWPVASVAIGGTINALKQTAPGTEIADGITTPSGQNLGVMVEELFKKIGEGSKKEVDLHLNYAVEKGIISQETADKINPLATEITAAINTIGAGKAIHLSPKIAKDALELKKTIDAEWQAMPNKQGGFVRTPDFGKEKPVKNTKILTKDNIKVGDTFKAKGKDGIERIGIVTKIKEPRINKIGQLQPAGIEAHFTENLLFGNTLSFNNNEITKYDLTKDDVDNINKSIDEINQGKIYLFGDKANLIEKVSLPSKVEKSSVYENNKSLLAVHNINEGKLLFADETGGIANPSLAIIDVNKQELQGFGDISLITDRSMIEPGKMKKGKTFGADVYSPRYPTTKTSIPKEAENLVISDLKKYEKIINDESVSDIDFSDINRSLENSPLFKAKWLESKGIKIESINGKIDRYDVNKALAKYVEDNTVKQNEYITYVDEYINKLGAKKQFFSGYTGQGRVRYVPATVENASKLMNKEDLQGGESFFYGLGSVRARVVKRFKNISEIKKAKDRILKTEDFDKVKETFEKEFDSLRDEIKPYATKIDSNPFIQADYEAKAIGEYLATGKFYDGIIKNVPESLKIKLDDFAKKLATMPTEYFETKYKRPVQINEFKGAVVPKDVSQKTLNILKKNGITDIKFYDPKIKGDRLSKLQEFQGTQAFKTPLFNRAGGKRVSTEEIKKLIFKEIPEKDVQLIFDENYLKNSGSFGSYQGVRPEMKSILKPIITLYTKNGKVSNRVAFHESYHYIFNNFFSESERRNALDLAKKDMSSFRNFMYKIASTKYNTADRRAEEYLADQYARRKSKDAGYSTVFDKFFDKLDQILQSIINTINKVKARWQSIPNKQGGFARTPDFESKADKLKKANKALEEGKKRYGLKDKEIVDKEIYIERSTTAEIEKANKEFNKLRDKEAKLNKPPTPLEKELSDLLLQKEFLQDAIDKSGALKLRKYAGKDGLGEVTGKKGGIWKLMGDEKASEQGFESSEEARVQFENDRLMLVRMKDLNERISSTRRELAASRKEDKDAKSLNYLLNKTASKTEIEIAREQRKADLIKEQQKTQARLKAEDEKVQTLQDKIDKARSEGTKKMGFLSELKRSLFPSRALDSVSRPIIEKWFQKTLEAKQAGYNAFNKATSLGEQNFQEIVEFQAGKPTKYIKEAFDAMGTDFKRRGLSFEWIDNYMPDVWLEDYKTQLKAQAKYMKAKGMTDKEIEEYLAGVPLEENKALRLKLRPNFVKERFWPDYVTGMKHGLHPKYTIPADLIGYYKESGEKAIANIELINELKSEARLLPISEAPDSWVPVTARFAREGLSAPPALAELINGKFRDENNLKIYQHVLKAGSTVNKFLQNLVLSGGLPFTSINFFTSGQAWRLAATLIGDVTTLKFRQAYNNIITAQAFIRSNSNYLSKKWFDSKSGIIDMMIKNHFIDKYPKM